MGGNDFTVGLLVAGDSRDGCHYSNNNNKNNIDRQHITTRTRTKTTSVGSTCYTILSVSNQMRQYGQTAQRYRLWLGFGSVD